MDSLAAANMSLRYENRAFAKRTKRRLPVTVLTGFLGAGKTTVLRHILDNRRNLRIAAMVNDFASINMDGHILAQERPDAIVQLSQGCMCCSVASKFESEVWKLLQEDEGQGEVADYLIIEASGVTDPTNVIRKLERKFGKMTRARLDSVVCVVDLDAVYEQLGLGGGEEVAGDAVPTSSGVCSEEHEHEHEHEHEVEEEETPMSLRELICAQLSTADIVLLNKRDKVTQEVADEVEAFVRSVVPDVRVLPCSFGKLPLPQLLDVAEAPKDESMAGVLSHETTVSNYIPSAEGGSLRLVHDIDGTSGVSTSSSHEKTSGWSSVSFYCDKPLSLRAFQDFITCDMPKNVVRAKGYVWFAEGRDRRSVFHSSGRQRFSFEEETGGWVSQPCSQIVFLGQDIDEALINAKLGHYVVDEDAELPAPDAAAVAAMKATISQDDRFELLDEDAQPPGVVLFRVTGTERYKVDLDALRKVYGVNVDLMNKALLEAVNFGGRTRFLTCTHVGLHEELWLRFVPGGRTSFAHLWEALSTESDTILQHWMKRVVKCACGQ